MIDPSHPQYLAGHRQGQRDAYRRVLRLLDRVLTADEAGRAKAGVRKLEAMGDYGQEARSDGK